MLLLSIQRRNKKTLATKFHVSHSSLLERFIF